MQTFEEREALNAAIVRTINEASEAWGLECMR
jgi:regulator of protease activity HflC (stomatin/prohibitin superfamily)